MPTADPRDLQGTWHHNQALAFRMQRDMYGVLVPYNMDGAKVLARRVNSLKDGAPYINASATCRPPGPQWQHDLNMPFQILQSKDWIEFVFEEYHGRWQVILDPAKVPRPTQMAYMGYSVGHWTGDTLVVESSEFKQALWLDVDGTPLSANGKLTQRIRKVDNGDHAPYLEIVTTIVDPPYDTRPWSVVRTFGWQPRLTVFNEYNCEEQIGDPSVNPDAGLLPEPQHHIRIRKHPMRYASNILRLSGIGFVLAAGLAMASTAAAANTPTEAANKKTVLDFYAALNEADATNTMKERIPGIAEKYLSPDYKQHTLLLPGRGTDREKLVRMFQSRPALPPAGASAMPKQRTDAVMAEGDRVMLLTSRDQRDPATGELKPSYIFNMFRLKDGKLVEHWDVSPGMAGPPAGGPGAPGPGAPPGGPPGSTPRAP